MKKHLIIGFVLAAFLFACKGEQHEKEIGEINGLRAKLGKTDSLLKNVDQDMAERLGTEVKNNSQFIQFNINKIGDTLDFKTALFLSNYKMLLEGFESVSENGELLEVAVDSTEKTLNDLEHDISNNSLAKGLTAEGSIKEEQEHVDEMYEYASRMRSTLANVKASYDTLTPRVNEYMKTLNQRLAEKNATAPTKNK